MAVGSGVPVGHDAVVVGVGVKVGTIPIVGDGVSPTTAGGGTSAIGGEARSSARMVGFIKPVLGGI